MTSDVCFVMSFINNLFRPSILSQISLIVSISKTLRWPSETTAVVVAVLVIRNSNQKNYSDAFFFVLRKTVTTSCINIYKINSTIIV